MGEQLSHPFFYFKDLKTKELSGNRCVHLLQ